MDTAGLAPSAPLLIAAVLLDLAFGDPVYALHPIRILGRTLSVMEKALRDIGADGYGGGCLLGLLLFSLWVALPSSIVAALSGWHWAAGAAAHLALLYTLLALGDLFHHVWRVGDAALRGDTVAARGAIAMLVGRDTDPMDLHACGRAAIESLAENLVDGFMSALFWYALAGLPGLLVFKVASTMDSMVGYKTPRYLRFGWFGARLDDVMNYVPARLAWLLISLAALVVPQASARKGFRVGLDQHGVIPGPNPGWSEAAMAGALQRRLIGPIWRHGALVTELWLGDPDDPEGGSEADLSRALLLAATAALLSVLAAAATIVFRQHYF